MILITSFGGHKNVGIIITHVGKIETDGKMDYHRVSVSVGTTLPCVALYHVCTHDIRLFRVFYQQAVFLGGGANNN